MHNLEAWQTHPNRNRDNVLFVISRSKNKNVVVYEANTEGKGDKLKADSPIDVYWLKIDPSYVKKRRAKGIEYDKENLSTIERHMAYGITVQMKGEEEAEAYVNALSKRSVKIRICPVLHKPVAVGIVNGRKARIQHIFVKTKTSWLNPLPSVEYVVVTGVDIESGKTISEKVMP